MNVINPQKTVTPSALSCGGTATVTLSFEASAGLAADPADIVLIMDRSGSMTQQRMEFAKKAAARLIALIAGASASAAGIGGGSRMGLVSFSDTATVDVALTDETIPLYVAVEALNSGGFTNHKSAFDTAGTLFDPASANRKIIVLFTDGETTVGGDPDPAALKLRTAGVEIFSIGLVANPQQLNVWSSLPSSTHVAYTLDPAQLDRLFREIGSTVAQAGALDVRIRETLNPDFKITRIYAPTDGAVQMTGTNTLEWTIDAAGLTPQPETVSLHFEIMHVGTTGGQKPVNASITYEDRAGNSLDFPSPQVVVDCAGPIVYPEPCPVPTPFRIDGCRDSVVIDLPDNTLQSLGRIIQMDVTVRNVCPGRRAAVAVLLTETGPNGEEYTRGMKTFTLPALPGDSCQDVVLHCLRFVVPEDLDVTGRPDSICNPRSFHTRVIANYIDSDFICCDAESVIL